MVRDNHRITRAVVNVELARGGPGILSEAFPHVAPKERVSSVADFRIGIEEPQSGVGYCNSGSTGASVGELELAILVVGAGWASLHVDLVIVVFAGAFEQAAELQRVASSHPGKAVGYVENGSGGA